MSRISQFVTFGAAGELFAIPVERVQEILELSPVARLPRAPDNLLGMIDVRGHGVPVIDLRLTLGMPAVADDHQTRVIVLRVTWQARPLTVGLKTDKVFEVTLLDHEELDPAPEVGVAWDVRAVAGIGRRNGAFVTVLDLDRLFATPAVAEAGTVRAA